MRVEQVLPSVMIALSIGAALGYFWVGDIRHTIYWVAAAALTTAVTF